MQRRKQRLDQALKQWRRSFVQLPRLSEAQVLRDVELLPDVCVPASSVPVPPVPSTWPESLVRPPESASVRPGLPVWPEVEPAVVPAVGSSNAGLPAEQATPAKPR